MQLLNSIMARTLEAQVWLNDEGDACVLHPLRQLVELHGTGQQTCIVRHFALWLVHTISTRQPSMNPSCGRQLG